MFNAAKIWSGSGIKKWMVIEDNLITELGVDEEPSGTFDEILSFNTSVILPGLHDAHIHAYSVGRSKYRLQLNKPNSISEMQSKLEKYLTEIKDDKEWIIGFNWDQDYMEDGRYPTKQDLDLIEAVRPVLLFRACHHIGLLNSKALELLNIDSSFKDPDGGKIDRDLAGNPTGILRENALSLVTSQIEIKTQKNREKLFQIGVEACLKAGLTSIHTNDPKAFDIYQKMAENNSLPIRIFLTIFHKEIQTEFDPPKDFSHPMLIRSRVKLFADGSLGARTATLRQKYCDADTSGIEIHTQDALNDKVKIAKEADLQLEIHGIGDRAAEQILIAFETNRLTAKDRPVFTHCQVLSPDLMAKMKKMGVIANIQPPFVKTDSQWAENRLGTERIKYAYAWKTLLNYGINVSGGSDAPIEDLNPLKGIHAAMFRENARGEIWREEECLSLEEAINIYSRGAAYAVKREQDLGQISMGYLADFIIVNEDVIDKPEKLMHASIDQVWVNGELKLNNIR